MAELTTLGKLVSVAYPFGDVILLAAALRLALDGGKRGMSFHFMFTAIVGLLVTDFVYGLKLVDGTYTASCGSTSAGSASTSCGARRRCTRP